METVVGCEPARAQERGAAPGVVEPVTLVATALAVVLAGWHAWAALRGYFWQDDFRYQTLAAGMPLGSFLTMDYDGHLMPGQFLLVWLLARLAPLQYTVAVLPVLVLQAVGYVLAWKLLVRLFGRRWGILPPFAVVVCSPLVFGTSLWWAYALQLVPLQVALFAALHAHVGYLQTGRRRQAVAGVVWTAVGLACWEKALLIAPVVLGVSVALAEGGPVARLVGTVRRYRALWIGYLVLEVAYVVVFLALVRVAQGPVGVADFGRLARRMLADTFLPGVLGGPWQVGASGTIGLAVPPGWVLAVTWAAAGLLVVGGVLVGGRRAVAAWAVLGGYLACCLVLVAVARLSALGAVIGADPRYVTDAVPVAALCGALAFLRPRPAAAPVASGPPEAAPPEVEPEGVPAEGEAPPGGPAPAGRGRLVRGVAGVVTVAFVAGAAVSTRAEAARAGHAEARQYVEQARDAFSYKPDMVLVDTPVPEAVMGPLLQVGRAASQLFAPLRHHPAFDRPAEQLWMLDDSGIPRPVALANPVSPPPGPLARCGYPASDDPVNLPLFPPPGPGRYVVRIAYYTSHVMLATLTAGDTELPIRFAVGPHLLYLVVSGPFYQLTVDGVPGATVCLTEVTVGTPVPTDR